jgi:ribosomal protein S18 acetylase RimI-like enzyme
MTTDATIHRITPSNTALLDDLAPDVFDAPIDATRLAAFLAEPSHALFVATEAERVVAQARGMIHHSPDEAPVLYIDNFGVAPSHQRRGIGTRLFAALRGWAKDHGATTVWLATETDNQQAKGFYTALGLTPTTVVYFERNGRLPPKTPAS